MSKLEFSTITRAKIDRVDGSILELTESIFPLKFLLNAEEDISAFNPVLITPT